MHSHWVQRSSVENKRVIHIGRCLPMLAIQWIHRIGRADYISGIRQPGHLFNEASQQLRQTTSIMLIAVSSSNWIRL